MKSISDTIPQALRIENAGVYYWRRAGMFRRERFWALKKVSLDLKHGETLGVIGRNGVGKSTLLKLMAGIISPDTGKIISGVKSVSLLALQAGFSQHLTGRENAILNGMLLGMRRVEVQSRMDDIISFSELDDFMDQPIKTYSAGMKARLGFAVALQADPDLLLIDEAIGVGDEAFKRKSTQAMKNRIRSGKTVVLVSHNPGTIRGVCDRAVWVENGVSQLIGETDKVLASYQAFVHKKKQVSVIKTPGMIQ